MRRLALILATLALAAGCVTIPPPLVTDVRTSRSLRDVHQCVTEQLVDRGYAITTTRRDDGVVHAEQAGRMVVGGRTADVRNRIEVLIFEREGGDTSIQFVADTFRASNNNRVGPSDEVSGLPDALESACGQPNPRA